MSKSDTQNTGSASSSPMQTDADLQHSAVSLRHHPMQCQGQGDPLVFLDAAIIMGIKISQAAFLIQGILLHIQAAGIYVRTQDVHALFQRLLADIEEHNRLLHIHGIELSPRLDFFAPLYDPEELPIARGLCLPHCLSRALPLSLALRKESAITCRQFFQFLLILLRICTPNRVLLLILCHLHCPFNPRPRLHCPRSAPAHQPDGAAALQNTPS